VAMLNAYPSWYTFSGLSYGTDGSHYMDEILPNTKTAWVEGWANAFAAWKNDGKVFSTSMSDMTNMTFLKAHTVEEMSRNEYFNGKVLYDVMTTIASGKDKVFIAMSQSGPHDSLKGFLNRYLARYPGDQVAVARLLDKNTFGKMTQAELLSYVNNGSYTVSQGLYDYLKTRGSTTVVSNPPSTTTSRRSWWDSLASWFGGLFGNRSGSAATPSGTATSSGGFRFNWGLFGGNPSTPTTPKTPTTDRPVEQVPGGFNGPESLPQAHEEYQAAFKAFNEALLTHSPESAEAKAAMERLQKAKARLRELRRQSIAR